MKPLLAALLFCVLALCFWEDASGQRVLDLRNEFAFSRDAVEAVAERSYRARVRELAADGRLDADPVLLARLRELIAGLSVGAAYEAPGAERIAWEVHTCRRCDENASSMAGGRLMVGEEFIARLAPSRDELGFLLAHEMGHVLAEHTREFASAARYFVDNGLNRKYFDVQHELDESYVVNRRMAALYALQEFEADYIGLIVGARSGLDPDAMPRLLAKLSAGTHDGAGSLPATHPADDERRARALSMLEIARRIRERGVTDR